MKSLLAAGIALALAAPLASADVTIIDNKKTVTVDCAKDKNVNLVGNHLTITLRGTCDKIMVSGNHAQVRGSATTFYVAGNSNTVNADSTDELYVAGNKNTVSWKKGLSKPSPKISNPGKDNSITQAK